jgi:hypothetical protein
VSFGIVADHGGKISVTSPAPVEYLDTGGDKNETKPPGPGTVFFVELPLTKEGLPDEECPEVAVIRGELPTAAPSPEVREPQGAQGD